jgi:hypothetical protein
MLTLSVPSQGLLFGSFLYRSDLFNPEDLRTRWEAIYGKGFSYGPEFNPLAAYYAGEMGPENSLKRVFFTSSKSYPREFLLSAKLQMVEWEREWSVEGKRQVNVDVGFLTAENFLLATTKNYSHRVFLGQNIFADLTYYFHQGTLQTFPWTYPDYVDPKKLEYFTWLRSYLLQSISLSNRPTR